MYVKIFGTQAHHYIIPSMNVQCPQDSCITLSQFAADPDSYVDNDNVIYIDFLPGTHSLDREIFLAHVNNVSMAKKISRI